MKTEVAEFEKTSGRYRASSHFRESQQNLHSSLFHRFLPRDSAILYVRPSHC